ncbi:hypothetical protein KAV67_02720, partial [Candidatus Bipolaricaulota bacterium]|nr:hypothetical protein [Candidatus Bipolaricaulota bacterium]
MDIRHVEEKLTPAARQAIEELVDEYKERLLRKAVDRSVSYIGDHSEISVRDILEAWEDVDRYSQERPTFSGKILLWYSMVGISSAIGALAFLVASGRPFSYGYTIVLGVGIFGLVLALTSSLARYLIIRRKASLRYRVGVESRHDTPLDNQLVLLWRDIELALRDIVAARFGESHATPKVYDLVGQLQTYGELKEEQMNGLQLVLEYRNRIVHEGYVGDYDTLREAVATAKDLLRVLRRK